MNERTYAFLVALREQVSQKAEQLGGDALGVETVAAAIKLGIVPGSPEHYDLLLELVRGGYLSRHPNTIFTSQVVYRITPKGISKADTG